MTDIKKKKGLFLSFEGLDGVGKTTQIKKMISFLTEEGYEVLLLREPGGTVLGEEIRSLLFDESKKPTNAWSELFLFLASRAELWEKKIKPALEEGKVVICDRFMDSTIAYQAYGRQLPISFVIQMHQYFLEHTLPQRTYFLDMPLEKIEFRKSKRKDQNHFDTAQKSFKKKVQEGYYFLAQKYPKRILKVDADRNFYQVHHYLKKDLLRLVKQFDLTRKENKS